jgi:hypothetical protein
MSREVFDTSGAALFLGVGKTYLEKLRCNGGGPVFVKLGRRVTYRRVDLETWIAAHRRASTAVPADPNEESCPKA